MAKPTPRVESALKRKHVIFVLFSFELGGAERQALHLARYLKDACGARVEIWAFCNPGRLIELCEDAQIRWRLIPLRLDFRNVQIILDSIKLARYLRREKPDVILPYLTPANIYCGLMWRFTGAKACIWNQRNAGVERINPFLEKIAARNSPVLISNSRQGADFLLLTYGVRREKVHLIHNGVGFDPDGNHSRARSKNPKRREFVACMVANLHHGKDHETLIRAWALSVEKLDRPARLLLAGRFDDNSAKIKALTGALNLKQSVEFLGPVSDIEGLLHSVNLGILLSPYPNYEGLPNAVLEYMLAGLPVIGTDILGIREALGPENREVLVPIRGVDQLAELITKLAGNPRLCHELGARNSKRARMEFSIAKMCKSSTDVIINTLGCV